MTMQTAIRCATIDPPVWPAMNDDTGDDRRPARAFPTGHHCFYRVLAEAALDIVTVVDEFGTIVYKSPSTERHLGYRPHETVGRNVFEFIHQDDIPRVRATFDECRESDGASPPIECRYRHADGLWRTLDSVGRFQPDGSGGRIGIIHSRDVGARKVLEAQVRQAQKMEAVGLSTGAIAHDFNNMLVVIAGYTALLANDPSRTVREFAREMRMATDRATELTSQLLSFSRAAESDNPVSDVNGVIADFRPILDRMVGRDVHVSYALEAAPATVRVARSALDQVLINLAVNARDAMPAGGELTVTTSNEWRPRGGDHAATCPLAEFVVIRITDTGVGMAEGTKARIFEPFFTTKAPGRGTGIGLQTVHGIVTQAGGRIDVISAPGAGTTFRVLLPVYPPAPDTSAPAQKAGD